MKKITALILSLILLIGLTPISAFASALNLINAEPAADFESRDPAHWARDAADELIAEGIVGEQDSSLFKSLQNLDSSATRALAVSLLFKSVSPQPDVADDPATSPDSDTETGPSENSLNAHKFSDIAGHPEEQYILAAVEAGYVNGYPDATFRPDNTITRAEIAKITALAMGLKANENATNPFNDLSESDWEYEYVLACAENGLINGYSDGSFRADGKITCGESVTICARAHNSTAHDAQTGADTTHTELSAAAETKTPSKSNGGGSSRGESVSFGSSSIGGGQTAAQSGGSAPESAGGNDGTPLHPMGAGSTVAYNGQTATGNYTISTAAQLKTLADKVNSGTTYEGSMFTMTANISLSAYSNWTPIGYYTGDGITEKPFLGTFDGAGNTISNMKITGTDSRTSYGLFGYMEWQGHIKNLNLDSTCSINFTNSTSGFLIGSICGHACGGAEMVSNCTSAATINVTLNKSSSSSAVGGIGGYVRNPVNCTNTGNITVTGNHQIFIGGIDGETWGPIVNCKNTGTITGKYTGSDNGDKVNAGGICGLNYSTIDGCTNSGAVAAYGGTTALGEAGGIVGRNYQRDSISLAIINCTNSGTVTASGRNSATGDLSEAGGICSLNTANAAIKNCLNTGKVVAGTGADDIGGINGFSESSALIENCVSTGTFSGGATPAGICAQNNGPIKNCYWMNGTAALRAGTGAVSNSVKFTKNVGNYTLTGNVTAGGSTTNDLLTALRSWVKQNGAGTYKCWAVGNSAAGYPLMLVDHDYVGKVTKNATCTAAGVKTFTCSMCGSSYTETIAALGHNPSSEWTVDVEPTYTSKGSKSHHCTRCNEKFDITEIPVLLLVGSGTELDPFLIATPEQLAYLAALTNKTATFNGAEFDTTGKYFKLVADITLNDTTNWESWDTQAPANSWTPIGTHANPFKGTFDGDGHVVRGIYINTTADYQGLFGDSEGTIKNVGVVDSYIKGVCRVGGVIGVNDATVINCYNEGRVEGSDNCIGGVVGHNWYGMVSDCYNTGSVTSSGEIAGGVVGVNKVGIVSNCYNTGAVTGASAAGGVVGANYADSPADIVSNCYNTGTVSATGGSVGGVVGENKGGTVSDCYNTSAVSGNTIVGGVVGVSHIGTVSNCYNEGTVYSSATGGLASCGGGVVGQNYNGTVSNCYNTGTVTCAQYVGGVTGWNRADNGTATVSNCYNTGTVSGSSNVDGGVVGPNMAYNGGTSTATVSNCYCLDTACSGYLVGGGTVTDVAYKTAAEMKSDEFAALLDRDNDTPAFRYDKRYNDGFPILIWQEEPCEHPSGIEDTTIPATCTEEGVRTYTCSLCGSSYTETIAALGHDYQPQQDGKKICSRCGIEYRWDGSIATSFAGGSGTELDPYLIATPEQLAYLAALTNQTATFNGSEFDTTGKYFKLVADITLNDTSDWESWDTTPPANSWVPIGWHQSVDRSYPFRGTFDGDGHVVRGIYINTSDSCQGLFGYSGGIIKNVGVVESYIKGKAYVGGVVGWKSAINGGSVTVSNCCNTGAVSGNGFVGGVVGANGLGTVSNCYNTGAVTGSGYVGGVAGGSTGTVSNCYNTGAVTGIGAVTGTGLCSYVGGVVGLNYVYKSGTATVSNCYNTGTVSGKGNSYVGGVVGSLDYGTVRNCYNTGAVTGTGSSVGGVVGRNWGTVSNCYCLDTAYSGDLVGSNDGGTVTDVAYKTAAQMKCTAFATMLDRDNDTPAFRYDKRYNNGFPILIWQYPCEHSYTSQVTTQPTCTEEGARTYTCSECGSTYTEPIAATGHSYTDEVTTQPTCTEAGLNTYTCSLCGNSYTETIAALGHDWSREWTIDVEPTCTSKGSKSHHCTRCDEKTDVTEIPAEHDWSSEWTIDVEPTCTSKGSKSHHCNQCDAKKDQTVIEMTSHSYTSVTEMGIITYVCGACEHSYSKIHSSYKWYYEPEHTDCYIIQSKAELKALADLVDNEISFKDQTIKLSEDITAISDTVIGSEDTPFSGTLDGCGHTLTINNGNNSVFGVLGESCEIRNLIIDGNISGDTIGGIAAINNGLIINCRSLVKISAESFGGGFCGVNNGQIINCHALGDIFGSEDCTYGGVCGENNGKIYACLVSGTVDSARYVESDELDGRTVNIVNCEDEYTDRVWGFVVGENNGDVSCVYYPDEFEVETARHAFGLDTAETDLNSDNIRYFTSKGIISGKGSSAVKVINKLNKLAEDTTGANQWQSFDIGSYAPCTVNCE